MRSGLVQLMDRLCSLSSQRDCSSNEKQTKKQKVAAMAWAAFQVLANRCIEWEKVEGEENVRLVHTQQQTSFTVTDGQAAVKQVAQQMRCILGWHVRCPAY